HFGVVVHEPDELVRAADDARGDPHVAVRHDVVVAIAIVDEWLEDLDLLPRDLRPAQAPNQLLALAAEHAAGDDLDPAGAAIARNRELVSWRVRGLHGGLARSDLFIHQFTNSPIHKIHKFT